MTWKRRTEDEIWNEITDPPMYYDRAGQPISMRQWADSRDLKRVAQTDLGPLWISTVWLGIDHGFHFDVAPGEVYRPLIFETMVFQRDRPSLGEIDNSLPFMERMKEWDEANEAKLQELHPEIQPWIEEPFRYSTEAEALAGHDKICVDLRVLLSNIQMAKDVEREAIEKAMNDAPNPLRGLKPDA